MDFPSRLLLLFLITSTCLAYCRADNKTDAPDESTALKRLRQELLVSRQYDRMSRPVKNHLTQTKVDMRITINEFVELDTVNSMLVTDSWFHISWRDELLSWDPNDFQQLKQIHVSPLEIWKPDIVLINTADQDNLMNIFTDSDVLVNSTGDVTWITMGLLRSKCTVWAYDYPFTVRPVNCRLTFCSLIYQSHEVNITTPGNEFLLAGPWFVNPKLAFINASGERYEKHYEGYGMYSFESLNVQLKRRDNALPLIVRIPTLTAIVLTLCMFFIPVTWPVRCHFAIFAILIQLLLILYIGLQLGVNAIGLARPITYLRDDLFLTTMALVLTLAFRRILVMTDILPQMPYLISSILLNGSIGKLLCFGINQNEYTTVDYGLTSGGGKPGAQSGGSPFSSSSSSARRAGLSSIIPTSLQPQRSNLGDHVSLVNEDSDGPSQSTNITIGGQDSQNDSARPPTQLIYLSNSQYEWMQLIIFFDRVMFAFYALIMFPRLM